MPSLLHLLEIFLLVETLRTWMTGRRQCFIGGDMFVYFSADPKQHRRFRGPDFFAVLDVPEHPRRNWVIWDEGGHGPDVVIELLSTSTARADRRTKKDIYQNVLRVPEYYWFDPETAELQGFALVKGVYHEIPQQPSGQLACETLGLRLVVWEGVWNGNHNRWLRWATPDGELIPTKEELAAAAVAHAAAATARADAEAAHAAAEATHAAAETARADAEALRAEAEAQRADAEAQRAEAARSLVEEYRRRFGDLPPAPTS